MSGVDDVWRIHFVCDLNAPSIQNWLFMPPMDTRQANRLTLNLTFTIRECERLPIKHVARTCRERFELYYEELSADEALHETAAQLSADYSDNSTRAYFYERIQRMQFRDTFVSDSGLRSKLSSRHDSPSSAISVELRDIPLSSSSSSSHFVRLAIRDTGACISLLSVQASYVTCPALVRHGIRFEETPTGRDLTDLVQVNGTCPPFAAQAGKSQQQPKAICTAKGEWLITDSNLASRCQCWPGYEFLNTGDDADTTCSICPIGTFKSTTSNELKCSPCPPNSQATQPGSHACECRTHFFRTDEANVSSPCLAIGQLGAQHVNMVLLDAEHTNVSIVNNPVVAVDKSVRIGLECDTCHRVDGVADEMKCNTPCALAAWSPDWMVVRRSIANDQPSGAAATTHMKLTVRQMVRNEREIAKSIIYVHKESAPRAQMTPSDSFTCKLSGQQQQQPQTMCLNISANLSALFHASFPRFRFFQHQPVESDVLGTSVTLTMYSSGARGELKQLPTVDASSVRQSLLDRSFMHISICNEKEDEDEGEMHSLKLVLAFRSALSLAASARINIFALDTNIRDACPMSAAAAGAARSVDPVSSAAMTYNNRPEFVSTQDVDVDATESAANSISRVVLPVMLGILLVLMLIMMAIVFRRPAGNIHALTAANTELVYGWDKHLRKLMPMMLSKAKCSPHANCIDCERQMSGSSIDSSNLSSSMSTSTSGSSPSTTCTTSHIVEHSAAGAPDLYYVDPHTYEDPARVVPHFAQEISPQHIKIESVIGGGRHRLHDLTTF